MDQDARAVVLARWKQEVAGVGRARLRLCLLAEVEDEPALGPGHFCYREAQVSPVAFFILSVFYFFDFVLAQKK